MKKFFTGLTLVIMLVCSFALTGCNSKIKAEKIDKVIAEISYGIVVNDDALANEIDGYINNETTGIASEVAKCLRGEDNSLDDEVENVKVNAFNNIDTTDLADYLIVVVMDNDDVYSSVKNSSTASDVIYTGRDIVIAQKLAALMSKEGIAVIETGNSLADVCEVVTSPLYSMLDVIGINHFELKPYTESIYGVNMVSYYKNADHVVVVNKDLYKSNMTVADVETLLKNASSVAYVDEVGHNYLASLDVTKVTNLLNGTSSDVAGAIKSGAVSVAIVPTSMADSIVSTVNAKNNNWTSYIMIGVIVLLIVVMFIMSQRRKKKQAKEAEQTMSKFAKGCYVKTIGGVMGKVVSINENEGTFVVQTGTGSSTSYMKFDKQAIYQVSEGKKGDKIEDVEVAEVETETTETPENN